MKINNIMLFFTLLTSVNAYCGKTKNHIVPEERKKNDRERRASEILEIFSTIANLENRDIFFKKIIINFCLGYPGIGNINESNISEILNEGSNQTPILTMLFLMSLEKKEKHLIEFFFARSNLNCSLKYNITLLHLAARYNRIKVIKDLIEKGANINALDKFGNTPLAIAMHFKNSQAQDLFEQKGALKIVPRRSICKSCTIL